MAKFLAQEVFHFLLFDKFTPESTSNPTSLKIYRNKLIKKSFESSKEFFKLSQKTNNKSVINESIARAVSEKVRSISR